MKNEQYPCPLLLLDMARTDIPFWGKGELLIAHYSLFIAFYSTNSEAQTN